MTVDTQELYDERRKTALAFLDRLREKLETHEGFVWVSASSVKFEGTEHYSAGEEFKLYIRL